MRTALSAVLFLRPKKASKIYPPSVKKFFKRSLLYSEKENAVKNRYVFFKIPLDKLENRGKIIEKRN